MPLKRDERGQSLVEAAVALPVLLLLCFGLIQFGLLAWQRVMLQHAAYSAARAYTVWQAEEPAQALPRAERAAWLALRGTPRPKDLHVSLVQAATATVLANPEMAPSDNAQGKEPAIHHLELNAHWDPLIRLPFWRNGFFFSARCGILSESVGAPETPAS